MTAHYLVTGTLNCNCGGPWPCSSRHENIYVGATAIGPTAGRSSGSGISWASNPFPPNFPTKKPLYKFMIGQRAIYQDVIVTVCAAPKDFHNYKRYIWVDNPEKMFKHYVSIDNLKPLPDGQL